jgi:hypothetical protein
MLMNRIGQEVLGYWGPMHAYDDGVIVGQDATHYTIQWGDDVVLDDKVLITDMLGEWYLDVEFNGPKIGYWFANTDDMVYN